jgi:hypothetical protein
VREERRPVAFGNFPKPPFFDNGPWLRFALLIIRGFLSLTFAGFRLIEPRRVLTLELRAGNVRGFLYE